MKCSSMNLLNKSPMTAAGTQARMTLYQSCHVARFSQLDFQLENGLSFSKFSTTTARMAPSCMTTRNMSIKDFDTSSLMNSSTRIMCPVLLIGSHSVSPSTMPRTTVFKSSIILKSTQNPPNSPYEILNGNIIPQLPRRWNKKDCSFHSQLAESLPAHASLNYKR